MVKKFNLCKDFFLFKDSSFVAPHKGATIKFCPDVMKVKYCKTDEKQTSPGFRILFETIPGNTYKLSISAEIVTGNTAFVYVETPCGKQLIPRRDETLCLNEPYEKVLKFTATTECTFVGILFYCTDLNQLLEVTQFDVRALDHMPCKPVCKPGPAGPAGPAGPVGPEGPGFTEFQICETTCNGEDHLGLLPNDSYGINTSVSYGPNPAGTGFFSLQKPDGTELGGDCRGNKAIDLQLSRSSPDQVALGTNASLLGGTGNRVVGDNSVICNGNGNEIAVPEAVNCFMGSGFRNIIMGTGQKNLATNSIVGGFHNQILLNNDSQNHPNLLTDSFIGGGKENKIINMTTSGPNNGISDPVLNGGFLNLILCSGSGSLHSSSAIGGGSENAIKIKGNKNTANCATIAGGCGNQILVGTPSTLHVNNNNGFNETYEIKIAQFGPSVFELSNKYIVAADPIDACGPLMNANAISGTIAIVEMSTGCDPLTQAQNVQNAGAIAMIVIGLPNEDISTMLGFDESIIIPSVMITDTDGAEILNELDMATLFGSLFDGISPVNCSDVSFSTISGGKANTIIADDNNKSSIGSTISGGQDNLIENTDYGTIAGGHGLQLSNPMINQARFACGQFNDETNMGFDRVFVIGGGTDDAMRSNLFSVDDSGNVRVPMGASLMTVGADFAEYFESKSGQSIPIGTTVELDSQTGKISACRSGETPFGVVSNTAGFIGNSYDEAWVGKYQRNLDGSIVYETIVVKEVEEGETAPHTRKVPKVSKDYDPKHKYIPRKFRSEWHVIGFMGQIRILKNQPVNPNWIKMKNLNSEFDLWLVK